MSSGLLASLSATRLGGISGVGSRQPRAQHEAGQGRMDMSRHTSPAARKFLSTSLYNDLVKALPHPEFTLAMRVAPAVVTLPLLIAGDGGSLDRVAAAVNVC